MLGERLRTLKPEGRADQGVVAQLCVGVEREVIGDALRLRRVQPIDISVIDAGFKRWAGWFERVTQ